MAERLFIGGTLDGKSINMPDNQRFWRAIVDDVEEPEFEEWQELVFVGSDDRRQRVFVLVGLSDEQAVEKILKHTD